MQIMQTATDDHHAASFHPNNKHTNNYKPKDFAELLNVSVKTLQRWDREGCIKPSLQGALAFLFQCCKS